MKTSMLITIFLITLLHQINAQEAGDVNFGILAGPNLTFPGGGDIYDYKQNAKDNNEQKPTRMRFGMHIGTRIEYFPADNVGFGTGLIYNQKGWTEKYGEGNEEFKYKVKLDYIEVPLTVIINLKGFHIYGGPSLSILVLDRVTEKYDEEKDKSSLAYSNLDYDAVPKSITGGFCLGVKGQTSKGFTYGAGLSFTTPVFPAASEVHVNMTTLQFSIGKVFTWKRKKKAEVADAYTSDLKNLSGNYEKLSTEVASISNDLVVINQKVSQVSSMNLKMDELSADVREIGEEIKTLEKGGTQNYNKDFPTAPNKNAQYDATDKNIGDQYSDASRLPVPCYVVSCGTYSTESGAKNKVWELQQKGLETDYFYIPDYDRYGKQQYRVYVGPYNSKTQAENVKPKVAVKVPGAWVLEVK